MIDLDRLQERIWSLPTFPGAVAELYEVSADPKATASDVERIVKRDPALTTNVLRIANSARFGLSRRVTGVGHAITLLGRRLVGNLAVASACTAIVPRRLPAYDLSARDFFRHSVATGVLAPHLARQVGIDAPDFTFLAGLLHDLGKLAITAYLAEEPALVQALAGQRLETRAAERTALGTDHAEVAALLARQWHLPEVVAVVAEKHHDPGSVERPPLNTVVALVHVANVLAHEIGNAGAGDETTLCDPGRVAAKILPQLDPAALATLHLRVDHLPPICREVAGQVDAMAEIITG